MREYLCALSAGALGCKARTLRAQRVREIFSYSSLTCVQQSVMNLGILMVQGLVNSFGPVVMAAFAAAVKIDAFAYMPVQDFGNALLHLYCAEHGAKQNDRIRSARSESAVLISAAFCVVLSTLLFGIAKPLMLLFVDAGETEILREGVRYLHIEGSFYCGVSLPVLAVWPLPRIG